ncbi:hypothetical protein FOZ62_028692, partial [Perkinsus olseni]
MTSGRSGRRGRGPGRGRSDCRAYYFLTEKAVEGKDGKPETIAVNRCILCVEEGVEKPQDYATDNPTRFHDHIHKFHPHVLQGSNVQASLNNDTESVMVAATPEGLSSTKPLANFPSARRRFATPVAR